jgi:hypothetical protein
MAPKPPAKPRAKAGELSPNKPEAEPPPTEPVIEAHPQPSYAAPPRRSIAPTVTAALLVLAVAVTLFGVLRHRGQHKAFDLKLGVPTAASVGDLRSFASAGRPVYWVGPPNTGKLEVTRIASGAVYVRYLPPGVNVGDPTAGYTTIATYPSPNAYATLSRSGRAAGAVHANAARHGLAVWRLSRQTSVYLAYRGTDYLIEVFDPSPRRARALALGQKIQPVS